MFLILGASSPLLVLLFAIVGSNLTAALWPAPHHMLRGDTTLMISESFWIEMSPSLVHKGPSDLKKAISRAKDRVLSDNLERLVVGRGKGDRDEVLGASQLAGLQLSLDPLNSCATVLSITEEANKLYEDQDESYTLSIPSNSKLQDSPAGHVFQSEVVATLQARTTLGLLRGMETFIQLVYTLPLAPSSERPPSMTNHNERTTRTRYILHTPIYIEDRPAFPHRGLLLDTSRNFFPLADILRQIDTMASTKLNVLHWHAVDSQSWPFEIPGLPEVTRKGAYSASEVYSLEDIQMIQSYAGERGISVLVEIDMPGHTASLASSYPEHISCLGEKDWMSFAAEPPSGQLKLGDVSTLNFARKILANAASIMDSPYFSSGGDEINEKCYHSDLVTRMAMVANNQTINELLQHFMEGLHKTLSSIGKTPVVWQELVLDHQIRLSPEAIILVWISSADVVEVVNKGYRIIHAASDFLYLDCGSGGWLGDYTGGSWCDPYKSWQRVYSYDPYANITQSQRELILGGEALVWSEQTDPMNIDAVVWPRAAAAAEVFWTGANLKDGSKRNASEALARLHDWRYRAVKRGVRAVPLQPQWCALRPHECDFTS